MTKNNTAGHNVVKYYTDDQYAASVIPDACGSFTRLPQDTSVLAQYCKKWGNPKGTWGKNDRRGYLRLANAPFHIGESNAFIMYSRINEFSCDDPIQTNTDHLTKGDSLIISVR